MGGCVRSLTWTKRRKKKKQCRGGLLWRMRAAVKKAVKNGCGGGGSRRQAKFQYDPSSYALNFDDGLGDDERANNAVFHHHHDSCEAENCSKIAATAAATTLVCVLWMEA